MFINYKDEIKNLQKKCYECRICSLGQVKGNDHHIFAKGKVPAEIMFVEEAGAIIKNEIYRNYFDNEMLRLLKLERKDIYVSSAVKCRPEKNRIPTNQEIIICRAHIDAEIKLINPRLIISLGSSALWAMCGKKAIIKNHGRIHQSREWSNGKTYNVFASYHPSFIMQSRGKKDIQKEVQTDLINLKKIIDEL